MFSQHKLDQDVKQALAEQGIQASWLHHRMLRLDACPVGSLFNKPKTNVLFQPQKLGRWQVFVDEDLTYQGLDPEALQLFSGPCHKKWKLLNFCEALPGNLNDLVRRVLAVVAGPNDKRIFPNEKDQLMSSDLEKSIAGIGRVLSPEALAPTETLTGGQEEAVLTTMAALSRRGAPVSPFLVGKSKIGKTIVSRTAAGRLLQDGIIETAVEIEAACLVAGCTSISDRDERFRRTLALFSNPRVLAIIEQVDLALAHSYAAGSLFAAALDRGGRFIGLARPPATGMNFLREPMLQWRVEVVSIAEPQPAEIQNLLQERAHFWSGCSEIEITPQLLASIAAVVAGEDAAHPTMAVDLLDAVVGRAQLSKSRCVGPDDLLYFVEQRMVGSKL